MTVSNSADHPGWKELALALDEGKTIFKWRYILVPDFDILEVVDENGDHAGTVVLYVREAIVP